MCLLEQVKAEMTEAHLWPCSRLVLSPERRATKPRCSQRLTLGLFRAPCSRLRAGSLGSSFGTETTKLEENGHAWPCFASSCCSQAAVQDVPCAMGTRQQLSTVLALWLSFMCIQLQVFFVFFCLNYYLFFKDSLDQEETMLSLK